MLKNLSRMWKGDIFLRVLWLGLEKTARSSTSWAWWAARQTPHQAEQSAGDNSKQQRPREHLDFGSEEADGAAIHTKSNTVLEQKWGSNDMTEKYDETFV